MAIVAECPVCGKRFKADEKQAGKKAKCSQCANVFVIGGGRGDAPPAAAAAPAQAARAVAAAAATPATTANPSAAPAVPPPTPPTPVTARPVARQNVTDLGAVANLPDPTPDRAAVAAPRRRKLGRLAAAAALLVALAGGSAVVVPKLLNRAAPTAAANQPTGPAAPPAPAPGPGGTVPPRPVAHHVPVGPSFAPTGPAWAADPDAPRAPLKVSDDFRLAIPGQPPLRHSPTSLVLAAPPSPYAAVTLLPDAGEIQPAVEVWNLAARDRAGHLKLPPERELAHPVLSQDGGYYAGHWYDPAARASRVEIWSIASGARAHSIDVPAAGPVDAPIALGFPYEDQVLVLGERLQVWDLKTRQPVREVPLPHARTGDTLAAASATLKLVAVADARSLTLIDLARQKPLGTAAIPDAVVAHPRKRLSLRGVAFSPDGRELALAFDNRASTRRVAVYDVATGSMKALLSPAAPVRPGGPAFDWLADGRGFLLGGGVLLDRDTGRQVGQVYGNVPGEGLGGVLAGLVDDARALLVWDRYPAGLVLRTAPVAREQPAWIQVDLRPATAARHDSLQCVAPSFGNATGRQSLWQTGRLTDGSHFLAVNLDFTAALAADAPAIVPLRQDQFVLLADGQPRLPIGTLTADGTLSLEKPEYDLRKNDPVPRRRTVVYAVTGREKSLAVRVAAAERPLDLPAPLPPGGGSASTPSGVALVPPSAERLGAALFKAPDSAADVSVRVHSARVQPFEFEPDAADHVPLRVTYAAPTGVLAVHLELTVNAPRTRQSNHPRLGLLLPSGIHLAPSVELPARLPATLGAGERRTTTCLFAVNPQDAATCRLTYEGVPVATITPDPPTAQSTP
jgi:hypothetical protein